MSQQQTTEGPSASATPSKSTPVNHRTKTLSPSSLPSSLQKVTSDFKISPTTASVQRSPHPTRPTVSLARSPVSKHPRSTVGTAPVHVEPPRHLDEQRAPTLSTPLQHPQPESALTHTLANIIGVDSLARERKWRSRCVISVDLEATLVTSMRSLLPHTDVIFLASTTFPSLDSPTQPGQPASISPRMQSMLQDVIELRDRKWAARAVVPTALSAVHEAAANEKATAETQSYQRQLSISRGGSRFGGEQNMEYGPDGWHNTAGGSIAQSQPKADMSQFAKTSKDAPEPVQREKLQLLPRTKPTLIKKMTPPATSETSEGPVQMSESEAKTKINEEVTKFFAARSLEGADVYFSNLPEEHRFRLVDKLVESALASKQADAVLVSEFFAQASSKGQCSFEVFEAGFMSMAEFLNDTAIDAPNAFKFMAIMLKGAGFDKDKERLARIAGKSLDGDKLLQLVSS